MHHSRLIWLLRSLETPTPPDGSWKNFFFFFFFFFFFDVLQSYKRLAALQKSV
jgi:hypothetical protein